MGKNMAPRNDTGMTITTSHGMVHVAWNGNVYRASFTITERTAAVVDNSGDALISSDISVLAMALKSVGMTDLADRMARKYRNL